jgi:hypothetical protein
MPEEHTAATKADVQAVKTELMADIQVVKADVQAVKADVQAVKAELMADIQVVKADVQAVKADVQAVKDELKAVETRVVERLLEAVQDAETRVLNAFYGFAQTNQKRMTLLEGTDSNMVSRLGTIESRVLEIEKRLNMPPAA